jgi:hypothetical protein
LKGESIMAVFGPATGHYGRDSIGRARSSGGTRTPAAAYDRTGAIIPGAYIENGRTYFGNGTPISKGTKVVDDSGREWVKTSGGGGELTGVNYGIDWGEDYDIGNRTIGKTGAITASDYYEKVLEEQQRAIQERINSAVDANNAYIPQINQRSDQALQNAYIAREQARVRAPQALNAMGYTGGPTETRLMGMEADYQNRRGTIEQDRQTALTGIQQNEAQIRSTGDATLSEAAQSYYNNLVTAAQRAEQQAQDQANWESEFALQEQQYSDAAAQQQWQNTYDEKLYELQRASAGKTSGVKTYGGYTFDQITDLVDRGLMSDETANSLLGLPGNTQPSGTGIRQTIGAVAVGVTPNRYTYRDVYNSIVPSRTPEGVRAAAQRLLAQGANPSYVEEALRSLGYQ